MKERSRIRRSDHARRSNGAGERAWNSAGAPAMAGRKAAVRTGAAASQVRDESENHRMDEIERREQRLDRRERMVDRREVATALREQALLPRVAAAKAEARASARAAAQLRRVNERLVLATVGAQNRTDAAEQVTAAMARAAHHDGLTGLPNRTLLADRLERAMALALRQGHQAALLFLDLDHFKQVNDTLGHPAGDLLLQSIARRLQACVRRTDTVCRQGGDEFLILLGDIREMDDAIRVAQEVIDAMKPAHRIGGRRVAVTLSIGISCFPDDGTDLEALVQAADRAMYQAKRNGRNRFHVYTRSPAK